MSRLLDKRLSDGSFPFEWHGSADTDVKRTWDRYRKAARQCSSANSGMELDEATVGKSPAPLSSAPVPAAPFRKAAPQVGAHLPEMDSKVGDKALNVLRGSNNPALAVSAPIPLRRPKCSNR